MMHQESVAWTDASIGQRAATPVSVPDGAVEPVTMLAYRSRIARSMAADDLDRILKAAQERNRREGLTGLLIVDQGCFFQWLEGPRAGLMRVWESIQRDSRHHSIEVLREQAIPKRFFGEWDMRLARRARGRIDAALAVIEAPRESLQRLRSKPAALGDDTWDRLFRDVVIPRLRAAHPLPPLRSSAATRNSPGIWHARQGAGAELAHILMAVDNAGIAPYVDDLVGEGASLEGLYSEVFEPAARCLGGLWDDDLSDEFHVTLGLGRLQVEARRIGGSAERPGHSSHSVLVASVPGEAHGLDATMSSEMFWRDGWDVSCEFPNSDQRLRDMVHERWFDVLDLSLSAAHRREHRLAAMQVTIRAAQAASLNPALAVIVGGREFAESPLAFLDVGADAGCLTSIDVVASAQRLLDAIASRNNPVTRLAGVAITAAEAQAEAASMSLFEKRFISTVF